MRAIAILSAAALTFGATAAQAEFTKIDDQSQFVSLVSGKELRRPFVNLEVSADGAISGMGAAWPVTGNWTWQGGYFCRDLYWGGDPLGYNCQEVQANADRIRFTSDKGTGDSAEFRLK
jgi:hypothetical protein